MLSQNEHDIIKNSKSNKFQNGSPRDVENIHEIRKLIREQSNLVSFKQRVKSSPETDLELDLPFKRFSTLPDIPRVDDAFYRTESNLKIEKLENEENQIPIHIPKIDEKKSHSNYASKKDTFYHFASSSSSRINLGQKFSSFENDLTLRNALDLDEDLPLSNEPTVLNQRLVFTCPVARMISPIKRPQAPSPPTSPNHTRSIQNSESDAESNFMI